MERGGVIEAPSPVAAKYPGYKRNGKIEAGTNVLHGETSTSRCSSWETGNRGGVGGYRATKAIARDELNVSPCTLRSTNHGSRSRVPTTAALGKLAGKSAGKRRRGESWSRSEEAERVCSARENGVQNRLASIPGGKL